MSKIDTKLEYRSDFPDLVFDTFSSANPIVIINGNVEEQITTKDGKFHNMVNLLIEKAINGKQYDFVIVYNAASKNMVFGDEYIRLPKKQLGMKEDFMGLGISISADHATGNPDQIATLLDQGVSKPHQGAGADSDFFTLLRRLAAGDHGKTFLVIIDHGDDILPNKEQTPAGASHAIFPSQLTDLARDLKGPTPRHMIVIDNNSSISKSFTDKFTLLTMPHSTEAEVRNELAKATDDKEKLIHITRIAVTLQISVVMDAVRKYGKDFDALLRVLVKLRADEIEKMSQGNLKATIGWNNDQVALPPAMKEYCDGLADDLINRPGILERGIVLVGPPGTGKSIIPQYIAQQIGVPFLRMGSMTTEGWSGVGTQKLELAFDAIEANKPCIVLIDELELLLPSDGTSHRSNNDEQFRAVFQTRFGDKNALRGVLFFGTSNHPERLEGPLRRSGRFGDIIAVLPPKTVQERINIFKAVWRQLENSFHNDGRARFALPDDDVLAMLLEDLPSHITGADFSKIIMKADGKMKKKKAKYSTMFDALLSVKNEIMNGTFLVKAVDFDEMVERALNAQNVRFDEDVDSDTDTTDHDPEILKAKAVSRMVANLEDRLKREAEVQADLERRQAKLREEKAEIENMMNAGLQAMGEKGEELAQKASAIEERSKEVDIQMQRLNQEIEKSDALAKSRRAEVAKAVEFLKLESIETDRSEFQEIASRLAEIASYNMANIKDKKGVVDTIDKLLSRITDIKRTIFGITSGKDDIDALEAKLKQERARFETAIKREEDLGKIKIEDPPWKNQRQPTRPIIDGVNSASGNALSTLRRISQTTAGKVAAWAIGITATGALYYWSSKESHQAAESANTARHEIITFSSQEEGVAKGYITIIDGTVHYAEGYEWAYADQEILGFPYGDPRKFAVRRRVVNQK